jgi:CheY-like chemotaxis protein
VRREIAPLPPARGRERALVQVFLNLLINAAQALPAERAAANEISVRTDRRDDWLMVEIGDNGDGIPADVLPRLGEPFFTTKPIGEGTGLGLAVSRSTLRAIGGKLEFESQRGRTVARVLLPEGEPPAPADEGPAAVAVTGLRILIVDDDERVARSLQRALAAHHITSVSSGAGALELLGRRAEFDLILCDLMMPGMTGMEFYRLLSDQHPHLADLVVFATGGAFSEGAREFCDRHADRVLAKPVSAEALTLVLARAARLRPSPGGPAGG